MQMVRGKEKPKFSFEVVESYTPKARFAKKISEEKLIALGNAVLDEIEKVGSAISVPAEEIYEFLEWGEGSPKGRPNYLKKQLNKLLKDRIGAGKILHVGQQNNYAKFVFALKEATVAEEEKWKGKA